MPDVSVVMPAHNAERYIAASIRSALESRDVAVEVIVVDDGSTDRTAAAAAALNDSRVQVISIAASGGPARPRNVGISHARATYISLLDSDDLLKPDKLAASVAALERCPNAGFAFGDFEKMDADGNVFERSMTYAYPVFRGLASQSLDGCRLVPQQELARGLLYENFVGTSGVVARRRLIEQLGGFYEALTNGDDLDLWFRLAHSADAVYLPAVGHSYRIHPTSMVHGPPGRNARARLTVLRRERARRRDPAALRHLDRRIGETLAVVAYQERLLGRRWQAAASYLRAYLASLQARWLAFACVALLLRPRAARYDS
jgi:GT2 family glycosyltransferase